MANAKCRSCDHAAAAGACCSSCAADIMAGPPTPSTGTEKEAPPAGAAQTLRSLHSTHQHRLFQ